MKKILTNLVAIGSIASCAIAPGAAFAESSVNANVGAMLGGNRGSLSASANAAAAANFCDFIKDKSVDDFKKWDARAGMMDERRGNRDDVIANIRARFDDKQGERRDDREAHWDDLMAKWEANAKTDAEKSAIAQFKAELQAAMNDHQADIDAAVSASRDGRDDLRAEVRADIDAAVAVLKDDVAAALDRAQADCNRGVSSATVRTSFAAEVKTATDKFKAKVVDIKADAKVAAGDVRNDRKDAMMESRSEFRNVWARMMERFRAMFNIKAKGEVEIENN